MTGQGIQKLFDEGKSKKTVYVAKMTHGTVSFDGRTKGDGVDRRGSKW